MIWLQVVSVFILVLGIITVALWENLFDKIMKQQLSLANTDTYQYKYWQETPMDIMMNIHFFNWTNSKNFANGKWTKPKFEEVGPYVFAERHTRANVVFNDNNTISFNTVRKWVFDPEKSNGKLDDVVISFNPIVLSMASVIKNYHYLIRKGVHYFLSEYNRTLILNKTVNEYTFEGIDDMLITLALRLKLKTFKIPYDRLGWFYARNNSASYDGNFTMWTGSDDIQKTGIITEWNQSNVTGFYEGSCGRVDGTTGEVWYPVKDSPSISIFLSDTCSKLTLEKTGTVSVNGIEANLYEGTDRLFDNGTKYPEMSCFSTGDILPSGVRNISACKYSTPVFLSAAHYTLADPWYTKNVKGMHPDPDKYKISFAIEPKLGLPLDGEISFQANILADTIKDVGIFKNVKRTMIPMFWIGISAKVPDNFVTMIKLALAAPTIGLVIGIILILVGVVMLSTGLYFQHRNRIHSQLSRLGDRNETLKKFLKKMKRSEA